MSASTTQEGAAEKSTASTIDDQLNIRIEVPHLTGNLPCTDLFDGSRERYMRIGIPLYEASIKGDWKAARIILDKHPDLVRFAITENCETPLHIAASTESSKRGEEFVKNLVNIMEKRDLELENRSHNTALHLAAAAGNVKTVAIMINRNHALVEIPGSQHMLPLYMAALFGKHDMARYLYKISNRLSGDFWSNQNRGWLLQKCVENGIFDVALNIVDDFPNLVKENNYILGDVLLALARKTEAFDGVKPPIIWRIIKSFFALFHWEIRPAEIDCKPLQLLKILCTSISMMSAVEIGTVIRGPATRNTRDGSMTKFKSRILFVAAKNGNTRFIVELIRLYPDLIWKVDDNGHSIFHIAVKRRHESIYNILYEIGPMKDLITPLKDHNGNNMLHLLGKSTRKNRKQDLPGVALQMQRELLWYKEVEGMIPPNYRERTNNAGFTPYELFRKGHIEHVERGEQWMKDTSSQCMVVAALIATIVFAAAFTVPGGYNQDSGAPSYHNIAFMVFVISNAASLIFSSTSVLVFLSVITSTYADDAFLELLPKKLMFGLGTLFLSVLTMMLSFSASFFALYHGQLKWLPIMVTGLASLLVFYFATQQLPLLLTVFYSTYRSTYLFRPKTRQLY